MDLPPGLIDSVPEGQIPGLFHSHVLYQFPTEARRAFWDLVAEHGSKRDLAVVPKEGGGEHSVVEVTHFLDGVNTNRQLPNCDSHGYWLEWLGH